MQGNRSRWQGSCGHCHPHLESQNGRQGFLPGIQVRIVCRGCASQSDLGLEGLGGNVAHLAYNHVWDHTRLSNGGRECPEKWWTHFSNGNCGGESLSYIELNPSFYFPDAISEMAQVAIGTQVPWKVKKGEMHRYTNHIQQHSRVTRPEVKNPMARSEQVSHWLARIAPAGEQPKVNAVPSWKMERIDRITIHQLKGYHLGTLRHWEEHKWNRTTFTSRLLLHWNLTPVSNPIWSLAYC